MRTFGWILAWSCLVLAGCVGQLQEPGDDDDAADDDTGGSPSTDDDAGDDDGGDDDAGDDDTGDDDGGDDDGGDDDAGDDDTAPPPCTLPNVPSVEWEVPPGAFSGSYDYAHNPVCAEAGNSWRVMVSQDLTGLSSMTLGLTAQPFGGGHYEAEFSLFWQVGATDGGGVESGGPDCFLDIIQESPSFGGCFQCVGVPIHGVLNKEIVDIVDGAFLCP